MRKGLFFGTKVILMKKNTNLFLLAILDVTSTMRKMKNSEIEQKCFMSLFTDLIITLTRFDVNFLKSFSKTQQFKCKQVTFYLLFNERTIT